MGTNPQPAEHLVSTIRLGDNIHQVRLKAKIFESLTIYKYLGAGNPTRLNIIAKMGHGDLYLMEENLRWMSWISFFLITYGFLDYMVFQKSWRQCVSFFFLNQSSAVGKLGALHFSAKTNLKCLFTLVVSLSVCLSMM